MKKRKQSDATPEEGDIREFTKKVSRFQTVQHEKAKASSAHPSGGRHDVSNRSPDDVIEAVTNRAPVAGSSVKAIDLWDCCMVVSDHRGRAKEGKLGDDEYVAILGRAAPARGVYDSSGTDEQEGKGPERGEDRGRLDERARPPHEKGKKRRVSKYSSPGMERKTILAAGMKPMHEFLAGGKSSLRSPAAGRRQPPVPPPPPLSLDAIAEEAAGGLQAERNDGARENEGDASSRTEGGACEAGTEDRKRDGATGNPPPHAGQQAYGEDAIYREFLDRVPYWESPRERSYEGEPTAANVEAVGAAKRKAYLFEAYDGRRSCVMGDKMNCRGQVDFGSDGFPLMEYMTSEDEAAFRDTGSLPPCANMCELCYTYFHTRLAEEIKRNDHITQYTVTHHTHKTGVPGEYARECCILSTDGFTDGILGHVRRYNTREYLPTTKKVTLRDGSAAVVRGFLETADCFFVNRSSIYPEVHRMAPYVHYVPVIREEFSTEMLLRKNYQARGKEQLRDLYAAVFGRFADTVDACERALEAVGGGRSVKWPFVRLHEHSGPPPTAGHSVYYAVLLKLNVALDLMLNAGEGAGSRAHGFLARAAPTGHHPLPAPPPWADVPGSAVYGPSDKVKFKLSLFCEGFSGLLNWMERNAQNELSDERIRGATVEGSRPGHRVPLLSALEPKAADVYEPEDFQSAEFDYLTVQLETPNQSLAKAYSPDPRTGGRVCQPEHVPAPGQRVTGDLEPARPHDYDRLTARYVELLGLVREAPAHQWPRRPEKEADVHRAGGAPQQQQPGGAALAGMEGCMRALRETLASENLERGFVRSFLAWGAGAVFAEFSVTLAWVRANVRSRVMSEMLAAPEPLYSVLPTGLGELMGREGRWECRTVALCCLLRVWVSDRLCALEGQDDTRRLFDLRMYRNSHADLILYMCRTGECGDEGLERAPPGSAVSPLELYYPYDTRALSCRDLPDVVNSYSFVDFFSDCRMGAHSWHHMQYKKVDKCRGGRGFDTMQDAKCVADEGYYAFSCLELEVSLTGMYPHCKRAPAFRATLEIHAAMDGAGKDPTKHRVLDYMISNESLTATALSESMVHYLRHNPALREILGKIYDWEVFERRVECNADMVRQCYRRHGWGCEPLIREAVFDAINLSKGKHVYRQPSRDFVNYVCEEIHSYDVFRYTAGAYLDEKHSTPREVCCLVDSFVLSHAPNAPVDIAALASLGVNAGAVGALFDIYRTYADAGTNRDARELLESLTPVEYNTVSYFFNRFRKHNNLRAVRIDCAATLAEQAKTLCEARGVADPREVPEKSTSFVVAPCCEKVKTPFPSLLDSKCHGQLRVTHNVAMGAYTCGRKADKPSHGAKKPPHGAAKPRQNALKGPETLRTEEDRKKHMKAVAKKKQKEQGAPPCVETEIVAVNATRRIIEVVGYTTPKKNRKAGGAGGGGGAPSPPASGQGRRRRRRNALGPAKPPFWITPCCGIFNSYSFFNWTPNGYKCGATKEERDVLQRFDAPVCLLCGTRRPSNVPSKLRTLSGESHHSVQAREGKAWFETKVFDDVRAQTFVRCAMCTKCAKQGWVFESFFNLSHIQKGLHNRAFIKDICD